MIIHPTHGSGRSIIRASILSLLLFAGAASAQDVGSGTRNLHTTARVTGDLAAALTEFTTVTLDQNATRPFAYVGGNTGWAVLDLSTPSETRVVHSAPAADPVTDIAHYEVEGRTFIAVASGRDVSIYDVTDMGGSADPARVGNIPVDAATTLFAYRHSDGRAILIVSSGGDAMLYDAASAASGEAQVAARIQTPELPDSNATGFERSYAAFHVDSETDRFYGAGAGGYHVFDITDTDSAVYITSATPAAVRRGHMVSATPNGRFVLAGAEYRAAPLRVFDMQPALDGDLSVVRTSVGAWTHDWTSFLLAHELRWPLVFVAAGERGLQVFNMRDPEEPYTYAYLNTSAATEGAIDDRPADVDGAVDLDVRNHDGLIAVVDRQTGLWLVRLDAFQGWDGRGYGMPNISSVQNWTNGPDGSTSFTSP